jgi:phenylacetyl-CoA:acceptor oxidoreductase
MADLLLPEATDLEGPAADPHRRHQVRRAVLGPPGVVLRQPAVEPQGEARDFTWIATELARRTGLLERIQRAHQPRRRRRAAVRRGLRLQPRPGRCARGRRRSGTRCLQGRQRRALAAAPRCTTSPGSSENGFYTVPMVARVDWYLTPTCGAGPALRAALPGAPAAHRQRTAAAACTSRACTGGTSSSPSTSALPEWHDVPGHLGAGAGEQPARSPRTTRSGCSPPRACSTTLGQRRHPADGRGGAERARPRRRDHERRTAERLGIADGDRSRSSRTVGTTRGRPSLVPRASGPTRCSSGQFDHWATPYAKDF